MKTIYLMGVLLAISACGAKPGDSASSNTCNLPEMQGSFADGDQTLSISGCNLSYSGLTPTCEITGTFAPGAEFGQIQISDAVYSDSCSGVKPTQFWCQYDAHAGVVTYLSCTPQGILMHPVAQ